MLVLYDFSFLVVDEGFLDLRFNVLIYQGGLNIISELLVRAQHPLPITVTDIDLTLTFPLHLPGKSFIMASLVFSLSPSNSLRFVSQVLRQLLQDALFN